MKIQIAAVSRMPYLPYVYGLLRAYIEDMEPELAESITWGAPLFFTDRAEKLADQIDADTDVLGLSCYMWNFNRQMKMAKIHKERNPDCIIIAGGSHIPNDPTGFLDDHPYIDIIVHGEGEITFAEILKKGGNGDGIRGVTTRTWTGGAIGAKLPKEIDIKSPYTAGYFDDIVADLQGDEYWVLWETNRGCPYACSFCDWGSALMNKVRRFPDERVYAEIAWFAKNRVTSVFLADANFGMLPRDLDFAKALASTKQATGFPRQLKPTFAKRSSDRVFEMSKLLSDAQMTYGTTLSMQSMDEGVLANIDRANIGTTTYRELQRRYTEAGMLTYTEMILGLPGETKESFITGLCNLLEEGNHEDIKVWELMVLPNAPISMHVDRYDLRTVRKNLFLELPNVPVDEVEVKDVVVQTDTMPFEDWVDSYLFAIFLQTLHCGYYTRFITEFLHRQMGLSYEHIYTELMRCAMDNPDSILGHGLCKVRNTLYKYSESQRASLWQKVPGVFGRSRREPHDWLWLWINKSQTHFYTELHGWLLDCFSMIGTYPSHRVQSVISFNDFMMFTIDEQEDKHDPEYGKFHYDWMRYFWGDGKLGNRSLTYRLFPVDTHTGIDNRYPLVYDDGHAFANAAIGDGFYVTRYRHYIHREIERIALHA